MNISSLQTYSLSLDSSSGFGINSERANTVQKKCAFCGGVNNFAEKGFKGIGQEKEKSCAAGASNKRQTKRTHRKCLDVDLKIT